MWSKLVSLVSLVAYGGCEEAEIPRIVDPKSTFPSGLSQSFGAPKAGLSLVMKQVVVYVVSCWNWGIAIVITRITTKFCLYYY